MLRSKFFYTLATCMAGIVAISNFLVQFPVNYLGLENILTYAAFTYPITFLITDLANRKYGKIINITSIVGHTGNLGQANYAASKAGIIAFSKSLAIEYAKKNININCVSPGFIKTEMTDKINEEFKKNLISKIPSGNLGTGEDVSNCVAFLASDMATYINGETIHVNGGMYMA